MKDLEAAVDFNCKIWLNEIIKEKGRGNCYISEITVAELRFGAENIENPAKSHKSVDNFLKRHFNSSNFWLHKKIRKRKSNTDVTDYKVTSV